MGSYLNPGSKGFQESLNSEIYVDKTGLIEKTNAVLNTRQKFLCVSRPRRFGKSMAADMLAAYYDRGEDSAPLFHSLKISNAASYQQHLNQYDVLKVNMQEFLSMTHSMDEMLTMLQKYLVFDLTDHFHEVRFRDENNLIQVMKDIYAKTKRSFVILIDEWDCLFREYQQNQDAQKISGLPAGMAERQGLCCTGLYDGYSAHQEIWLPFCAEYVHRVFHDRPR